MEDEETKAQPFSRSINAGGSAHGKSWIKEIQSFEPERPQKRREKDVESFAEEVDRLMERIQAKGPSSRQERREEDGNPNERFLRQPAQSPLRSSWAEPFTAPPNAIRSSDGKPKLWTARKPWVDDSNRMMYMAYPRPPNQMYFQQNIPKHIQLGKSPSHSDGEEFDEFLTGLEPTSRGNTQPGPGIAGDMMDLKIHSHKEVSSLTQKGLDNFAHLVDQLSKHQPPEAQETDRGAVPNDKLVEAEGTRHPLSSAMPAGETTEDVATTPPSEPEASATHSTHDSRLVGAE
ncbi:hypothetical protein BJY00DRAFT_314181 [Aspergillus carlsbadensis]|nr:hypothetical protein BJY00DRAFT_314181 [Aspergillus carlsbadensis]